MRVVLAICIGVSRLVVLYARIIMLSYSGFCKATIITSSPITLHIKIVARCTLLYHRLCVQRRLTLVLPNATPKAALMAAKCISCWIVEPASGAVGHTYEQKEAQQKDS